MKQLLPLTLLLYTACGEPPIRPVRIATYSTLGHFPLFLAHELGYFQQEGVPVEFDEMSSGPKMVEALIGGSSDVGGDAYLYSLMVAAQGRALKTFFTVHKNPNVLFVVSPPRKDSIRGIGDLKGATIGIGSSGGLQYRIAAFLLARAGLKISDVDFRTVGATATAVAAIQHGKVDAAVIIGSLILPLKQQAPGFRVLLDLRSGQQTRQVLGIERFPGLGIFATDKWLAHNTDKARRLARAMRRTLAWIREHSPDDVMTRIPVRLKTGNDAFDLEELRVLVSMLSDDGRMPAGGPQAVQQVLAASMDNVNSIDLASTWTDEFLEDQ